MLALICAAALAASAPRTPAADTVPLPTLDLGTVTEKVADPATGRQVEARVKYSLEGSLKLRDPNDGMLLGGHVVVTRSESPVSVIAADEFERLPAGGRSFESVLNAIPQMPAPVQGALVRGDLLGSQAKALGALLEGPHKVDLGVGAQPGGWTRFEYGSRRLEVTANYDLIRQIEVLNAPATTEHNSIAGVIGMITRLDTTPTMQRFFPDPVPGSTPDPETLDLLKNVGAGVLRGPEGTLYGVGYLPTLTASYPLTSNVSGRKYANDALGAILNTVKPVPLTPELLGSVNLASVETLLDSTTVGGDDMNSLNWQINPAEFPNCTGEGFGEFPGGTLWVPDQPGYQVMSNYSPFTIRHTFGPFAVIDSSVPLAGEFRTHCMNMTQKEPGPGVRYRPYRNTDPVLKGLMDLTAGSRIRGPWDQARLWIYTNKAGIDEINKRLFPGVSEAQYLTSIKQIAALGGLEPKDYSAKELFPPKLLSGAGMADTTLGWGFGIMERSQAKELAAWLGSMSQELSKLLAGDAGNKAHAAKVFSLALNSPSQEVRASALKGLLKKPQGHETLRGQLGTMLPSLYSAQAGEVESALDVLAVYSEAPPRQALEYLAANGANGKIQSKAAALLRQ